MTGLPRNSSATHYAVGSSIVLIILGIASIVLPLMAGVSVALLAGAVVFIGGLLLIASAFASREGGAMLWRLLVGVVYVAGGIYLLLHPGFGLLTLTLLLAFLFLIEGVTEVISYFSLRSLPGSVALLLNGLVTLVLSVMIWRGWPSSSTWAIGTLIGINLITTGLSRLRVEPNKGTLATAS